MAWSKKRKIGNLGEDIVVKFLKKREYKILERNYLRKFGEIDIVAEKDKIIHFVEVKSVTRENMGDVTYETDGYRPEDNIHPGKIRRLQMTIIDYLQTNKYSDETEWVLDACIVEMFPEKRTAKVRMIENIV